MKFLFSSLLLILLFLPREGYSQSYKWVRGGGSTTSLSTLPMREAVYSMCADRNGNIYSLSVMGGTSIVADTFYRPAAFGSYQNLFLTSHTCNGQMRFAKLVSGVQAYPYAITCDTAGHLYVAFYGLHHTAPLRIGYDTTITGDIYLCQVLAQFDTNGHFNWVRFVGSNTVSTLTGGVGENSFVSVDNMNNVHFLASVRSGVQITPSITSIRGTYDLAYDAGGSLLSVHRLELDSTLFVKGITIDRISNKLYAHGYRDNGTFPDSSGYPYVAAFNPARNRIWIDTFTNPYYSGNVAMGGITADGIGNLYLTPNAPRCFVYRGDTAINKMSVTSSKIASVMKLDTSGAVKWIKTYSGNTGINSLLDITVTPTNKVATVGVMTNHVVCGTDTIRSYTGEGQNAYFTVLDTAGYIVTLQQMHGAGFYDLAYSCAADRVGNLYIGGQVENNIWGGSLPPYTSVGGDTDYFIMKYGVDCSCTSMPVANYFYSGSFLSRSFTYSGTTTGVDSVRWTFGDGGTSTSLSPVHTYTGSGTFTTCVRVYTSCGMDMHCKEITTTCASTPVAVFTDTGKAVHGFTYTGTTAGLDSVNWNFGDGNTGSGTTIIHIYAVADTYTVCATVYTNCGTHTWCKEIVVKGTVGVSDMFNSSEQILVYPNPTKGHVNIKGLHRVGEYTIYDLAGKTLQTGTLGSDLNVVTTTGLERGQYILEVRTGYGVRKMFRLTKL